MTRKLIRRMHAVSASILIGFSANVFAQDVTDVVVGNRDSLLPERWCIETHMATPSLAMLLEPRPASARPWGRLDSDADIYWSQDDFADRSALDYRLAELDSDRLLTFWKGDSFGIFLGITRGGFISLSIAQ